MFRLFLGFLLIPIIVGYCPVGTLQWPSISPSHCFEFMANPATFAEANLTCASFNSTLVSIHEAFTSSWLQANGADYFSNYGSFWIGAYTENTKAWKWTDGSPEEFSDWSDGSPMPNSCGIMSTTNGYWATLSCNLTRPYVCEFNETSTYSTNTAAMSSTTAKAPATQPSNQPCDSDDWIYNENTNFCYYFVDKMNWTASESFCTNMTAHLASIHSDEELASFKFIYNGDLWIGLHATTSNVQWNTTWVWTDGSFLDYSLWYSGYPSLGSSYTCVYGYPNGGFVNYPCASQLYGICKKPSSRILPSISPTPLTQDCPNHWTYNNQINACYLFPVTAANWTDAEKYCVINGGHLASAHNSIEYSYLSNFNNSRWIGLYTDNSPVTPYNKWYWSDNTSYDYVKWGGLGVPNFNDSLCVVATSSGYQNYDCSVPKLFTCKTTSSRIIPSTTPVPITPTNCSTGWNYFAPTNSCYLQAIVRLNWNDAAHYCEFYESNLTSIHSDAENGFLYKTYGYNYWIGLYSTNSERTWKWNDGTSVDYLNWSPSYPSKGNGDCVYFYYDYCFVNYNCNSSLSFICKKPSLQ